MANTSNWMSTIPDSKKIINVNIPGTHDSGTFNSAVPYTKTQDWSIEQQLNQGIRFLDIRLSKIVSKDIAKPFSIKNSAVYILMHGPAPVGGDFAHTVLSPINQFLDKNPTEMVFMSIKSEESKYPIDAADMEEFATLERSYDHKKNIEDVEMSDLRGKIVLLNRVTSNCGYPWNLFNIQDSYELHMHYYEKVIIPGIPARHHKVCLPWPLNNHCHTVTIPGITERTQKTPNGWNYAQKTSHISDFLKKDPTNANNKLNINFLTASSSDIKYYPLFTNGVLRNSQIQNNYITNKGWSENGMIFPIDFPNTNLMKKIISSN